MNPLLRCLICWIALAISAVGHVVTQIFSQWKPGSPWALEVFFDAGYAVPEWRGDSEIPAPTRDWLVGLGEAGWPLLRREAERYLRESVRFISDGEVVAWQAEFIDFSSSPPDFPTLLNDGAYFRVRLSGSTPLAPLARGAQIAWSDGPRPTLVLKLPGKPAGYLSLEPGETGPLPAEDETAAGRAPWLESFRQGFLHVLPLGLDHVLFVMGLFFYQRRLRPLLWQSLAFTVAHTVTLGLAAANILQLHGEWVEPVIALSLIVVALENLRPVRKTRAGLRLLLVFGFGLIHGLGFADALSVWLGPGEGFLTSLLAANLGVEVAQVAVLIAAWCLTLGWHRSRFYPPARVVGCLVIALAGGFWLVERI
ncbi:MAG: HupE/UreJ family protein [Akkermansiaceae bacterium]